jgi:UDP-N-acetylmuramoyl-tripeptide--D-alanyl-D-alanine ligase
MTAAPLWTAGEAAAATGGNATRDWTAGGVSIDSRSVAAGDLFVALKGPKFDGHDFVAGALGAGAAAAMVERVPEGAPADAPLLVVGDTMEGLNALGRAARARTAARIAAVTGSVGKTGTKEALKQALAAQGPTAASASSFNNQWGVPLSLARMPAGSSYGVFEVGMNHPGEITPLSRLIRPDVAIITTVAPAHTEFFPSLAAVADAKAEIFAGMSGGAAVLNRDNEFFGRLVAAARAAHVGEIVGFGADRRAEARLLSCRPGPEGSDVSADICGIRVDYRIGIAGRHHVINSLAVLAAVRALGADVRRAAAAMAALEPLAGRGRRHRIAVAGGALTVIDESYNANPASMRAAIETLATLAPGRNGRRIAVLGEMRELGASAAEQHAALGPLLRASGVDLVFAAGPALAPMFGALPETMRGAHEAASDSLAPLVARAVHAGDVVTIKGSLASRMRTVVDALLALGGKPRRAANG